MNVHQLYYLLIRVNGVSYGDDYKISNVSCDRKGIFPSRQAAIDHHVRGGECPSDMHIIHVKLDVHSYVDKDTQEGNNIRDQYPSPITPDEMDYQ